ncbi:hypothetical protein RJ640_020425 [Escallonia rubra]|uniref:Uncharacterized protein n=1 Tax=Escallonia rubra TaxID=112253 RepID=A0AA88RK13_9ASTE|nr:hypothetical protein RJ640_020425 [Escallonia rubra]
MLGNCVETIQSHISTISSSQEAWERLLVLFANRSRSRVMSLKEHPLNNPRGTRYIPEYLQHMRAIADDLALVDNPLSEDDLVLYTLGGVRPKFKEIVPAIRPRDTPISFDELYDKLGDCELHLKKEDPIPFISTATANYSWPKQAAAPTTNVTTLDRPVSPSWIFDIGASHHVTSNTDNLQTYSDYGGPDEINISDGLGL